MSSSTIIHGQTGELVNLGSIERELANLWRSTSERGAVATRACRSNLVVLADDPDSLLAAEGSSKIPELLDEVTALHPARLITVSHAQARAVADGDGQPPAPIQAQVSALCRLRPGGGLICREQVALLVMEGAEDRVASMVRGLAMGGLPIVLLASPIALERFAGAGLIELADRVLVDTTGATPDVWTRLHGPTPGDRPFVDLAWTRLKDFRQIVARAIARSPMRRAVNRIEAVDIAHARRPTPALLLAAWLGHRLNWGRPQHRGPEVELKARGRPVRLRIGEAHEPETLVLLLRAPEVELRISLAEDSMATVALGAGRLRLRRHARPGDRRRGHPRPKQFKLPHPNPASHVVHALDHQGLCDRDASSVLARAMELAAALAP